MWNTFYPLSARGLQLADLLALTPLWGTRLPPPGGPGLEMVFWGYGIDGRPMPGLQAAVGQVDGPTGQTEVDLFLVGGGQLIAVEAKRGASPGRCGRFVRGRCPEVNPAPERAPCRYWEPGPADFGRWLEVGKRPLPDSDPPPCSLHYQLFRTLVVGAHLAHTLGLEFGLWLVIPRQRWPRLERIWLDFAERVRAEDLWRRLRVIAWEDLLALGGEGNLPSLAAR